MTIQIITPLPTPVPSRLDPVNFSTRADTFLASLPTFGDELNEFATEANTLALQVQNNKVSVDETYSDMQDLKNVMEGVYSNSVATSNFKGTWASLSGALAKPASVFHNDSYWILLKDITNITLSEPSDLNTDWLKSNIKALDTSYDSTESSLSAINVQQAIDEVYEYASGYLGNGSAINVDEASKETARIWLGIGSFGFKNRLINGNFSVDQRNSGNIHTITAGASLIKYTVDRWYALCTGNSITIQRVAGISTTQHSLRITGSNSNSTWLLGQRIEASNCADIVNKDITVSFKAKSSTTRVITWKAFYANSYDSFTSKTMIATGTITVNTNVNNYNFSFNSGANIETGLAIEFSGTSLVAGATIDFDNIQLEVSNLATETEHRSLQQDLFLCQRYYQTVGSGWAGGFDLTTRLNVGGSYLVSMRSLPTCALLFTGLTARSNNNTVISASTTIATSYVGINGAVIVMDGWIGGTINAPATMVTNPWLSVTAEL